MEYNEHNAYDHIKYDYYIEEIKNKFPNAKILNSVTILLSVFSKLKKEEKIEEFFNNLNSLNAGEMKLLSNISNGNVDSKKIINNMIEYINADRLNELSEEKTRNHIYKVAMKDSFKMLSDGKSKIIATAAAITAGSVMVGSLITNGVLLSTAAKYNIEPSIVLGLQDLALNAVEFIKTNKDLFTASSFALSVINFNKIIDKLPILNNLKIAGDIERYTQTLNLDILKLNTDYIEGDLLLKSAETRKIILEEAKKITDISTIELLNKGKKDDVILYLALSNEKTCANVMKNIDKVDVDTIENMKKNILNKIHNEINIIDKVKDLMSISKQVSFFSYYIDSLKNDIMFKVKSYFGKKANEKIMNDEEIKEIKHKNIKDFILKSYLTKEDVNRIDQEIKGSGLLIKPILKNNKQNLNSMQKYFRNISDIGNKKIMEFKSEPISAQFKLKDQKNVDRYLTNPIEVVCKVSLESKLSNKNNIHTSNENKLNPGM